MSIWTLPFVVLATFVLLQIEWIGRRRTGSEPSGWRHFLRLLSKKTSSDLCATALAFAISTTLLFSLWEGLLRAGLDLQGPDWRLVPGFLCVLVGLALRRLRPRGCHAEDLLVLVFGAQLILGAWFSVAGLAWIFVRSRHLPAVWRRDAAKTETHRNPPPGC